MSEVNKKFGEVLRELRRSSGKSISEITEYMGWSKPYLMELETGRSAPPAKEKIDKIAQILGTDGFALFITAIQDRKRITLQIDDNKHKQSQFAALLYREWDNMSEDQIEEIEGILNRKND